MLGKDFQHIKNLTLQITKSVELLDIDKCNKLLDERLQLLHEISFKIDLTDDNSIKEEYIDLLKWLTCKDKIPHKKSVALKNVVQGQLSLQKRTNFAIKQYKSTT